MSRNALSLSDQQLKLVVTASRLLPVEIRQWFLSRVADALSNIRHPADGRVRRAITDVLNSVRTPIPLGLFDQWQGRR